jgi:hypothetical protein
MNTVSQGFAIFGGSFGAKEDAYERHEFSPFYFDEKKQEALWQGSVLR